MYKNVCTYKDKATSANVRLAAEAFQANFHLFPLHFTLSIFKHELLTLITL